MLQMISSAFRHPGRSARTNRNHGWPLAVLLAVLAIPLPAIANTLTRINTQPLPDNQLQVVLSFSQKPAVPTGFVIEKPARIIMDFAHTRLGLSRRRYRVNRGAVNSISVVAAGGLTRLVFNLDNPVPYKTIINGKKIIVTLSTEVLSQLARSTNKTTHFSIAEDHAQGVDVIKKIIFHQSPDHGGLVTLILSNPNQAIDLTRRPGRIVITAINAFLPPRLRERMIVSDFGTPITTIDARQNGNNVRLIVHTHGEYEQSAYQANNQFSLDVKPVALIAVNGQALKPKYTGQQISFNFQNIPVRSVLQILASFTGLNLVVSDQVRGNITLRLKNVPWDQALAIILQTEGLAERHTNNVIMIAPAGVIQKQEQEQLQAREALQKLAPLHTEIFQVRYTKATALAALLKQLRATFKGGVQQKSGLSGLTTRGSVVADPRTNSLIVRDTIQGLANVEKLIKRLDVPVKQVLISARLVIAKQSFSRDLGVKFGMINKPRPFGSGGVNINSTTYGLGGYPPITPNHPPTIIGNQFNVNLPATSPTSTFGLTLAKLNSTFALNLEISAAEQEGLVRQISSPRVITTNDQTAIIQQGIQIPYQLASSSGATAVSFKTAALELQVTPHITPNNRVLMDLNVSNNAVGVIYNGVPSIDTQQVKTQVMVENGQTVVLGGVYEESKSHTVNKVPFFGDLPVIGNLFKERIKKDTKSELLIFITPRIINNNLSLAP